MKVIGLLELPVPYPIDNDHSLSKNEKGTGKKDRETGDREGGRKVDVK